MDNFTFTFTAARFYFPEQCISKYYVTVHHSIFVYYTKRGSLPDNFSYKTQSSNFHLSHPYSSLLSTEEYEIWIFIHSKQERISWTKMHVKSMRTFQKWHFIMNFNAKIHFLTALFSQRSTSCLLNTARHKFLLVLFRVVQLINNWDLWPCKV
jgi:hypothetical protein